MAYKQKYKSDVIDVTTSATSIVPGFDIECLSIYPTTGSVLFRVYDNAVWGDWIQIDKEVSFNENFNGSRVEIKSESGTVSVNYFIKGRG